MKKETQRFDMEPVADGESLKDEKNSYYQGIINEHLNFIEMQCRKAVTQKYRPLSGVGNDIGIENEALELNNTVLDKLREKNFRVLRKFKGNARVTTYITAIISNQAVDLIRRKKGRGREKERAKKIGDLGVKIYEMVFVAGVDNAAVHKELRDKFGFKGTMKDVETVVEKIKGKGKPAGGHALLENGQSVKAGIRNMETGEVIVPDSRKNPEELVIEAQREEKLKEIINGVVSQLSGEERLILRMRFPVSGEEEPKDIDRISKLLGISKKAVYNRISRILKKCRDMMANNGVNVNDLF